MASLKHRRAPDRHRARGGSPQLIAVASLKHQTTSTYRLIRRPISTANRCGLVEAPVRPDRDAEGNGISTANRCGLVEARRSGVVNISAGVISAANRCGLVEAASRAWAGSPTSRISTANRCGLVEAALVYPTLPPVDLISTANRCGLVEAGRGIGVEVLVPNGSPQLIAVASLKRSSRYRTSLSATDLHS